MKKRQLIFPKFIVLIALKLFVFGISNDSFQNEINENKRILSVKNEIDVCYEVVDSFESKYEILDYETIKELNYNGNDEKLINFLKDKSMLNSIKYLKTFFVHYSIIILVDIILAFIWIYSCSCYCKPSCCCLGERGCFCKLSMIITILMYIGLITNGVFGIIFWHHLKRNLAEAGCSFNKIFDHFKNGFGEDYDKSKEWSGFDGIVKALSDSKDIDTSELKNKYETIKECKNTVTSTDKKLVEPCRNLKTGIDIINKIDTSSIEQLEKSINLIKDFNIGFLEVEKNYKDEIISIDNSLLNSCNLFLALFILLILFGALSSIILLSYAHKCQWLQCLYLIVWNIDALFMIIFILMGISFGIIGSICSNIISISLYSTSSKNLDDQNPIIFNKFISNYVDICTNKNPTLSEYLNLTNTPINELNNLIKLKETIEGNIKDLNNYGSAYNGIADWLNKLNTIINNIYSIYNNKINIEDGSLFDIVNCRFIRKDLNIFFDIVKNHLIKCFKRIEIIFYFSGLYIFISIIFGLIVIKRTYYKNKNHRIPKPLDTATNLDSNEDKPKINNTSTNRILKKNKK